MPPGAIPVEQHRLHGYWLLKHNGSRAQKLGAIVLGAPLLVVGFKVGLFPVTMGSTEGAGVGGVVGIGVDALRAGVPNGTC